MKGDRMKYIYTCILSLLSITAIAQEVYTLEQCREMALEHNKERKTSLLQGDKAKYDVRVYRAKFFPHLSAQGNFLFSQKKLEEHTPEIKLPTFPLAGTTPNGFVGIPAMPISFDLNKSWTAGVNLKQPLFMGGQIVSAYKMAKIGREMAEVNQQLTNAEVIFQTDNAYWTLLKVKELLLASQKYEEVVEHLLADIKNAYEVGMKSRNDMLKVQVKLNEARLQRRRAENGVTVARMNLCHVLGLPLVQEIEIVESSLDGEAKGLPLVADVLMRPEYQLLDKQMELKRQQIRLTRGDYLPKIGVSAGWNYYDAFKLNETKMFKGGSFSALFSVSVPLFQWGEGINRAKSMRAEQQIAELQRDDASEKMMLEMTVALNQVDESKLEVAMTTESLAQAEENLKISADQFEVGLETLTEHLEAQTLWQKAWAENIESKAQLRLNETKYLKASGQLDKE